MGPGGSEAHPSPQTGISRLSPVNWSGVVSNPQKSVNGNHSPIIHQADCGMPLRSAGFSLFFLKFTPKLSRHDAAAFAMIRRSRDPESR